MKQYTLQDNEGTHQIYYHQTETGGQLLYFDLNGTRATYFNGRLNLPYTVIALKTETGITYTLPRRAPAYLFYSPEIIGRKEQINVLDIYNCPLTAIHSQNPAFVALPGNYTIGDTKAPTRQQWSQLIENTQPLKLVVHLPETTYNPAAPDFSAQLTQYCNFAIQVRNWFYTQKRKTITPKSKNHAPVIFVSIGKEVTDIAKLTETEIKSLFNIKDVEQYFEKYGNFLPDKETWIFNNKTYKTIDGEPELQENGKTEKIIQILLNTYRLRINLVKDESEVWSRAENTFIPLDDKMLKAIKIRINDEFGIKIGKDDLAEIIFSNWNELLFDSRYKQPTFHPYQDYFLNLPDWNGNDNIKRLYEALTIENIKVSTEHFTPESLTRLKKILPAEAITGNTINWNIAGLHFFKLWIVGVVHKAMIKEGKNTLMPILCGGTNKGKSTYIEYLLPPELVDYQVTGGVNPSATNYETAVLLRSKLLINFDDEPDSWNATHWKGLKTMITLPSVTYRAKYDKVPATYPCTASFISTTNFPDILNDPTGTRRFVMFPVLDIERFFWHNIDIDQVWTQAANLALQKKISLALEQPELQLLLAVNEMFFVEQAEEQLLSELLSPITIKEADAEITPVFYQAYQPLNPQPAGSIVLMREVDITHYINTVDASIKIQPKNLRAALQKLGFKESYVYKQRTFNSMRNSKCYAVKLCGIGSQPPPTNNPDPDTQPASEQLETPF